MNKLVNHCWSFVCIAILCSCLNAAGKPAFIPPGIGNGLSAGKTLEYADAPVILVADAQGCAESMAAVVKGFESLDPELQILGVIFNRVGSPRHLELLTTAVQAGCRTPVLGCLPRRQEFRIPDRHLGLMMGAESPLTDQQLDLLAETVTENIDIDLSPCPAIRHVPFDGVYPRTGTQGTG